jgi:hypothetical protein
MRPIRQSLAGLAIALAVAPAVFAQSSEVLSACKGDIEKLCPNVQPGGGRIAQCLKANKDQVSPSCKLAIAQGVATHRQGANGAVAPKPQ